MKGKAVNIFPASSGTLGFQFHGIITFHSGKLQLLTHNEYVQGDLNVIIMQHVIYWASTAFIQKLKLTEEKRLGIGSTGGICLLLGLGARVYQSRPAGTWQLRCSPHSHCWGPCQNLRSQEEPVMAASISILPPSALNGLLQASPRCNQHHNFMSTRKYIEFKTNKIKIHVGYSCPYKFKVTVN